jgi:hypothetical protein
MVCDHKLWLVGCTGITAEEFHEIITIIIVIIGGEINAELRGASTVDIDPACIIQKCTVSIVYGRIIEGGYVLFTRNINQKRVAVFD